MYFLFVSGAETKNPQLLVPKIEICDEAEKPFVIPGRIQKVDPQGPELGESCEKGNMLKRQRIRRRSRKRKSPNEGENSRWPQTPFQKKKEQNPPRSMGNEVRPKNIISSHIWF